MMAGIVSVSQVDWCLTSNTAALFSPVGRFSMPVMRFWMPKMAVPLSTASLSQRAHIQYIVVLLTNSEAMTTNSAHGMTVRISHNMCKTERIRGMANLRRLGRLGNEKADSGRCKPA